MKVDSGSSLLLRPAPALVEQWIGTESPVNFKEMSVVSLNRMFRGKIRTNTCRIVVLTSLVWLLIDVILIVKYADCPSTGGGSSWLCKRNGDGYDVEVSRVI